MFPSSTAFYIDDGAALTKLPIGITPRMLSREQAAEYCGCDSLSTFDAWQRRGIVPSAMPETSKWDRKAIDRALDRQSGLVDDPDADIDAWLREHS